MNSRGGRSIVQLVALATALLFALGSAPAQDVTYNVAPGVDIHKYKTYKWIRIDGGEAMDQIQDAQIRQAIDTQLAAKGLRKVDNDNADIYVGYQMSVTQEKEWNIFGAGGYGGFGAYGGYGMYGGYGTGWDCGGTATMTSTTLHIGTLGFDVYDSASRQLVWRGAATKTLNTPKDPAKRQKNLDKAVAKLLKNFAPPPKKD